MQPMRTLISFCHAVLSGLPSVVSTLAILLLLAGCQHKSVIIHRENGWYHVTGSPNDSLSLDPIVTTKDFISLKVENYTGKYALRGQLSQYKIKKWAKETEKAIGHRIAFLFNDSILTTVCVNKKNENGIFEIISTFDQRLPYICRQLRQEKIDSIESLFKGWDKDSLFYAASSEYRDSVRMAIDYWQASAWVQLITKPNEHYWYSITDSCEYKRLEKVLKDELSLPGISSKSSDWIKSKAYQEYKLYLNHNPEYINLMFNGFLFKNLKGLYGYLVDDIIQTKYPSAPSIRRYVEKTDNFDDERFAVYHWQRKVWLLMNKERQSIDHTADSCHSHKSLTLTDIPSAKSETQPSTEEPIDQRAGQQVIEALSKAYGTDLTVIGDFLDSPRCPAFLEGMFFDGSTLVFQVRGDTTVAQRTLEAAAKSGAFRLEPATAESFTQKQLKEIMNTIRSKHDKLADLSLKNNMISWGMGSQHIYVTFIMNTPEARKAFREKIIDSPAVLFDGTADKTPNDYIGVSDTLGILLQSDYPVYSTQSKQVTFVLVNHSQVTLESGESYYITYEDGQGVWRNLPIHTIFNCVAHIIGPGKNKHLYGSLYPEIHHNKPGRYRFFYPVTFTDTGRDVTLMAEFRLTDNPKELAEGQKEKRPAVPSTQDNRPAGAITTFVPEVPTDDNHLFQVVECMPEFPGGMKGCLDFIQTEMCYPEEAKKAGIQGRVILQFIIEKDGTPAQPRIVRSIHPLLDKEALRIIRQMPKWIPGKQDGKPQRVLYTIPVPFQLPKS